jgi:predicted acylesterase/phospholipase RssA
MTARTGLALSGGGFRATLYHLGVIRYLRDNGVLDMLTDIASVSGGSILGAHLALNWNRYNGTNEQFDEVARELIRFIQFDVRNHIVRRLPLTMPLRVAAQLVGADLPGFSANAMLERYYREFLYGDRRLFELPERPALHVLATNVSDGVMAVFNRDGLHIQKRNTQDSDPFHHVPGQTASVAKAVGASSAFPGFFPPVQFTAADLGVHDGQFVTESFTDGGVYDNLGTRAFLWLRHYRGEEFSRVLVSDAGKPFQILSNAALGFVAQSIRASDILWDRVWQLERENFGDRNGFFFTPVTRIVDPNDDPHALHPVVQAEVSMIRTDLDRFSDLEINALAVHGYEVARDMNRQIADRAIKPVREGPVWEPLPGRGSILAAVTEAAEHPTVPGTARTATTNVAVRLAEKLRRSGRRKVWSTLLDWKDWPTYIYLLVGLLLFVVLPTRFYQVHRHAKMLTDVINSIAAGDPDIRLVLDLVERDPTTSWQPVAVTDASTPQPSDFKGVEILSQSRIIDLRQGWSGVGQQSRMGRIRVRDRMRLRFLEEGSPRKLVFHTSLPLEDVEYRQPPDQPPLTVRRLPFGDGSTTGHDATQKEYELEFDLSGYPVDAQVTLELAAILQFADLPPGKMPMVLEFETDLLTVWMLFPENHPYRTYRLLRYPKGQPETAEPMTSRYTIDHPYGQLIGWSLISPESETVYECRWTSD